MTREGRDGGETPGGPDDDDGHRLGVSLHQPHGQDAEPTSNGDQRGLGAEYRPQTKRGQRREDDPGEIHRVGRTCGFESLGGLVATRAVQVLIERATTTPDRTRGRIGHQVGAESNPVLREGHEHVLLRDRYELQVEVGDHRHRNPDECSEHRRRRDRSDCGATPLDHWLPPPVGPKSPGSVTRAAPYSGNA